MWLEHDDFKENAPNRFRVTFEYQIEFHSTYQSSSVWLEKIFMGDFTTHKNIVSNNGTYIQPADAETGNEDYLRQNSNFV